jgi:hypothetical protein
VALTGVLAGPQGIADNRVFIDPAQAGGLANAAAILEVPENSERPLVGESRGEEGGAFAFGETDLAGAAGEHAALLAGAIAETDAEVTLATEAIIGTVRVLTTEEVKVFHEQPRSMPSGWWTTPRWDCRKPPGVRQR